MHGAWSVHEGRPAQECHVGLVLWAELRAAGAGIIGGLLSYCILNGANWVLDKAAEALHTPIAGTDAQPSLPLSRSFIGRIASNTGSAQQVGPYTHVQLGNPFPMSGRFLPPQCSGDACHSAPRHMRTRGARCLHEKAPCAGARAVTSQAVCLVERFLFSSSQPPVVPSLF